VTESGEPNIIYDGMLLAVQRLLQVELTERTFTVTKDSLKDGQHNFGLMKGEPFRVQISFRPEAAVYVKERQWSADQTISQLPDGGIVLEFTATSWSEVISWVLSFGPEATVLTPEDLREEIRAMAEELLKNYRQSE
jgi:predicted DNA-binding transcriptional regulator YafY